MSPKSGVDAFLELVLKSGVIENETLDPYVQQMRAAGTLPDAPADLAAALIRDGLLTPFQANQLLKGKWRGFLISGKYKLLDQLGAGGMGTVFLCEHKAMRRRVAIKVLPAAAAQDSSALERFYREARAAAALDHPNIVRAHDIDHDGKYHFLVLEYVEGASLEQLVQGGGPMDPTRAAHYIRQAALGLHHAHQAGLIHRDVKPANLLVDRNGVVKILDMGLARFFLDRDDKLTHQHDEGSILGTADYLAPEQAIDSHSVDIRADIYSLGATFYFLLAGRSPFGEGTIAQKLLWHQIRNPQPLREVRPDIPEGLATLVGRMMEKDRTARYQTPAEVYEALAPWTQTPIPPPSAEEMPQSGVRPRGGAVGDGSGSKILTPALASAPWLTSAPAPVFPSAEATQLSMSAVTSAPPTPPGKVEKPPPSRRGPFLWVAAVALGVLTGGGLVAWAVVHFATAPSSNGAPGTPPPLAAGPGTVAAPDKPAAAAPPGAQSLVCVASPDDWIEQVVFASPDRWECAIWAPDGKTLLCSSKDKLYRLRPEGGPPEDFSTGKLPVVRDYAFSPDGKRLAFSSDDAIFLILASGGEPAPILPRKSGYLHGWSPDGRNVVYNAMRGSSHFGIYSRPADGGEETRLTAYAGVNSGPDYSPDGKWIYFHCDKGGKFHVWRIPPAGGGPHDERMEQVTSDAYQDWFPHPSPDGKWLLFLSSKANAKGVPDKVDAVLRLAPLPGDKPQAGPIREVARIIGGQGTINAPCWSPDARRIAYVRYTPAPR